MGELTRVLSTGRNHNLLLFYYSRFEVVSRAHCRTVVDDDDDAWRIHLAQERCRSNWPTAVRRTRLLLLHCLVAGRGRCLSLLRRRHRRRRHHRLLLIIIIHRLYLFHAETTYYVRPTALQHYNIIVIIIIIILSGTEIIIVIIKSASGLHSCCWSSLSLYRRILLLL